MKKNKMMRTAAGLLVATLLSTCVISGTFAKYTTSAEGSDSARVAKWGFESASTISLDDLFKTTYSNASKETVKSSNTEKVIAPGTSGSATFGFTYDTTSNSVNAPEVAYDFTVSTEGSTIGDSIEKNKNIVWSLDGTECTATGEKSSWDVLLEKIAGLSGDTSVDSSNNNKIEGTKEYKAGELPTEFYEATPNGAKEHTVSWNWKFDDSNDSNVDKTDTSMGNADSLEDVKLVIKVTATQID